MLRSARNAPILGRPGSGSLCLLGLHLFGVRLCCLYCRPISLRGRSCHLGALLRLRLPPGLRRSSGSLLTRHFVRCLLRGECRLFRCKPLFRLLGDPLARLERLRAEALIEHRLLRRRGVLKNGLRCRQCILYGRPKLSLSVIERGAELSLGTLERGAELCIEILQACHGSIFGSGKLAVGRQRER